MLAHRGGLCIPLEETDGIATRRRRPGVPRPGAPRHQGQPAAGHPAPGRNRQAAVQGGPRHLAEDPVPARLDGAALAARAWRPGWTPMQCYLFEEELDLAPVPRVIPFGIGMLGPVLMAFGNAAQQKRYLPRILSSDDWWCQGFSEPGSGSDLASLRTRAEADGDHYLVNGGKTWTTFADRADMMFPVGAHRRLGTQAGRHLVPVDGHEKPRNHRPPDRHNGRRRGDQRGVLRRCRGAQGEPGGRSRRGLALRPLAAQPRALRHRRDRHLQAPAPAFEIGRRGRDVRRTAALRRSAVPRQDRQRRDRLTGAGRHGLAHPLDPACRPGAGPGIVDPEDQGHRDSAGAHRTLARSRRLLRQPLRRRGAAGRLERAAHRTGLRRAAGAALLQLAQGLDLRAAPTRSRRTSSPRWFLDCSRGLRAWTSP